MRKIEQQVLNYLNYCEKVRRMSPTTMRMKRNVLNRFVAITKIKDLHNLTNEIFDAWVADLVRQGVATRSINTYNTIIMAMIRYYLDIGVNIPLRLSLMGKLRESAVRRKFYTHAEIEKALCCADYETRLMIKIMFETGMRISELTYLKISNFHGRRIRFIGKGHKPREVYIRHDTLNQVNEFLYRKKPAMIEATGYLFATLNGEPPTVATIRKRLQKPFLQAGLEGFYPHALRHSFATNLQLKGASVAEIKEMMGHESIATTERYLHGFEGKLEELFSKYG